MFFWMVFNVMPRRHRKCLKTPSMLSLATSCLAHRFPIPVILQLADIVRSRHPRHCIEIVYLAANNFAPAGAAPSRLLAFIGSTCASSSNLHEAMLANILLD